MIVIVTIAVLFFGIRFLLSKYADYPTLSKVYDAWDKQDYQLVRDLTDKLIINNPSDGTAWAYKGYSLFFMSVSDNDTATARVFLEDAIVALRMALRNAPATLKPQVQYVLGKAYFHKNFLSAYHYYSDLAVYYLTEAEKSGIAADDIPEYLGLCYAQLSMPEESIAAFSEALFINDTDELRFAIAEQYIKNEQTEIAKQYLFRIKSNTADEMLQLKACMLLADIYLNEESYTDAYNEYQFILEKNPNNADAYYGIGIIYEKQGDTAKARAEWRKALKIQGNHKGALSKLG
ncbi:MAG: tetratricopeptide repeat protein [Treponemataceae bacterium]|nr:tetratricopeptide repeat protein [Treponemataceae bacterium]